MCAFQISPGVQVKEVDLTNVIPAVATSIGGYGGHFRWGPIEEIVTVGSEKELAEQFGTPDDNTAGSFFTAASFLKYGNSLKVVRATASALLNAVASVDSAGDGILIENLEEYENNHESNGTSQGYGPWAAKYAGALGNSIKVLLCPADQTAYDSATFSSYKNLFTGVPATSQFVEDNRADAGRTKDEVHVVVVDEGGTITGVPGSVLETFAFLSQASDALNSDGSSNYYKTVINSQSKYVYWLGHASALSDAGETAAEANTAYTTGSSVLSYRLAGGADATPSEGNRQTALTMFNDADTVDVNLLFGGFDTSGNGISNHLISIAALRKDIVVFVSPESNDTIGIAYATQTTNVSGWAASLTSSSYAVADSSALKIYDKYNDVYRWIPACGHMAGLCANADNVADAWFSPAGYNRGQLLGVIKLAYNPKKADRDTLYNARVNPIVAFPGQGIVLFGDKTALSRPSAFDRINVRRLFIVLEKAIATAAKYQLFEFNDEFTRAQFRNMVEPFLRDVQGRRGLTDFSVVCDDTNNTGDVIDRNEFRADIYIKPARSINYITLNFIATRTGVEFSELVG